MDLVNAQNNPRRVDHKVDYLQLVWNHVEDNIYGTSSDILEARCAYNRLSLY